MSAGRLDVIVIGGGPAGAACADILVRSGMDVAVVTKAQHVPGRVELCSARARALFRLGSEGGLGGVEVDETLCRWNDTVTSWPSIMNPYGRGLVVQRDALDTFLLRRAASSGVTLVRDRATGTSAGADGWTVHRRVGVALRARIVVDATGRSTSLRHRAHRDHRVRWLALSAISETPVASHAVRALVLERTRPGWWWALPRPGGGSAAGVCLPFSKERPVTSTHLDHGTLPRLWTDLLRETSLVRTTVPPSETFTGWRADGASVIHQCPSAGPGWIGVGDAVLACDPLSGQGLEFAAESAVRAAQAVVAGLPAEGWAAYSAWVADVACAHVRQRRRFDSEG